MRIVLITRDRPELTKQTIDTMMANAANWRKHDLFVVYDGDGLDENYKYLQSITLVEIHPTGSQLGVGGAKNFGVECLEYEAEHLSDGLDDDEIIMFSDNDMYYLPNWDLRLESMFHNPIKQLGGWKHPFHQPALNSWTGFISGIGRGVEVDAVTGNCFIIRYKNWLTYGPFDANAIGPGQSEDYALSQHIKAGGGIVATLDPPVAIHCGLTNCLGEPATGWEEMAKMAEKQLEENNIDKIWLSTPEEGTILLEKNIAGVAQLEEYRAPNPGDVGSNPTFRANYDKQFTGLNVGSGQRRFDTSKGWCNVDRISRPPDQIPDYILDATNLIPTFAENSQDIVVLHHVLEHFGCGEADEVLKQCYSVLKDSGSLLIFVPDLRRLAGRWLSGELDDFSFLVNVYGAYQGEEGDRHKWGYDINLLKDYLVKTLFGGDYKQQIKIKEFDWREIPGADFGRDWWVLALEVLK